MTAQWIKKVWNQLRSGSSSVVRNRRCHGSDRARPERLETRCLLAGNVTVSLSEAAVIVTGDSLANDLELVAAPGTLTLRGRSGTSINGAQAPFTISSTGTTLNRPLLVRLGAGNDVFSVGSDARFSRSVQVQGETGDDTISFTGSVFDRLLSVSAGTGNDSVVFSRITANGALDVAARGALQLAMADTTLNRSLSVQTATGDDSLVVTDSTINGSVVLLTGRGDDNTAFKNSTLRSSLYVDAGRGRDVVLLDGTKVTGPAALWMRQGDDSIILQGQTELSRRLTVGALLGSDRLEVAGTATTGVIRRLGRPGSVADIAQKDRITAPVTGAFAKAAAAVNQAAPQLTAAVNPVAVAETAGTAILTVSRSGSVAQPLIVQLSASSSGRITLPATLTIPAGSQSATAGITIVNNTATDGTADVQLTVAATGFSTGSTSLTVTDDDTSVPTSALTLTPSVGSVTENAGAGVDVAVSRDSADNSQPLIVTLSSTGGRLTVPASVTIPAGASSISFTAVPVNDQIVNLPGSQTLAATATGFNSGTGSMTVTDDDTATLTLELSSTTVTEGSAAVTATVSRNTEDKSQPVTASIAIGSDRATGPATVEIPAGQASVTFALNAVDNLLLDGTATIQVSVSAAGFDPDVVSLTVTDNENSSLGLTASSTSVREDSSDGIVLTVSRNTLDVSQALEVTLDADSGALTVPATAEIPAGQTSVDVVLVPLNDDIAQGDITLLASASATGFSQVTISLTVQDDEVPALSLTPAQSGLTEGSTTDARLTVSRNTADISSPLTVSLASSSPRISLPATIVIPAGQRQVEFSVADVNDQIVSVAGTATVQATASAFGGGQAALTITEDDSFSLSVEPAIPSVNELVGTVSTTVSSGKAADTDITVSLTYTQSDLLSGPASVIIPAGETSAVVQLPVAAGSVPEGTRTGTVTASIAGTAATDSATILVQDGDSFSLTTDVSSNQVEQSSGILLTRNSNFIVNGVTAPNATLAVDSDDDGQYDDAATTADSSGIYSFSIPLSPDGQDPGDHRLVIRATAGAGIADQTIYVHYAVGTLVRFNTTAGTFDVELLDADAPVTVANFLSYQASPEYSGLIVHRSVPNFVIQGGGFTLTDSRISSVQTNPPIQNEFLAANSNVRGTLAMAMVSGNINSGSSQWFVNVADNTFLDEGKYTVFGRVLGNGMSVVDQINNLTTYDLTTAYGSGALGEVPLTKAPPEGTQLTGTVSLQSGSNLLSGTGTAFTTELSVGTDIWINSKIYRVQSIASDTAAVLSSAASATVTATSAWKDFLPDDADFVVFSSIDELLPLLP
ncbi:MAG: Peptidyl-prolyl cis-trans isomerase precursor [Planctomycetota bacterium]|jgi:cyclophilin family peptidyl-prolyl cis-trans isomerase